MTPQKIALLTDSCADLSPQMAEENQIYVVPLRILCADGEYRDSVDIQTMTTMLLGYKSPYYLHKIGRLECSEETVNMLEDAVEQITPYFSDYF